MLCFRQFITANCKPLSICFNVPSIKLCLFARASCAFFASRPTPQTASLVPAWVLIVLIKLGSHACKLACCHAHPSIVLFKTCCPSWPLACVCPPKELRCMQASSQSSGWPPLAGILLEPKAHVQCGDFDRMVLLQVQTFSSLMALLLADSTHTYCAMLHTAYIPGNLVHMGQLVLCFLCPCSSRLAAGAYACGAACCYVPCCLSSKDSTCKVSLLSQSCWTQAKRALHRLPPF